METVPYLLALQGDVANQPIRSLALKLLVTEGEKRPDMLRQRVCAGVRQAYKFQRLVNPSSITAVVRDSTLDSDRDSVQCIFGPIYKDCLSSSKVQKQSLYKSLLNVFCRKRKWRSDINEDDLKGSAILEATVKKSKRRSTTVSSKKSIMVSVAEELPLLSYAVQILAHLPYTSSADVLFVAHSIPNITSVQGTQLSDRLANFINSCNERTTMKTTILQTMNWKKLQSRRILSRQRQCLFCVPTISILPNLVNCAQRLCLSFYFSDSSFS
ncbi:MAG: hypothetical protein ACREBR_03170, partial [bacterium]